MNGSSNVGNLDQASGGGEGGNSQLSAAFDHAMEQATQTLSITTKKGASLYALKQRPQ